MVRPRAYQASLYRRPWTLRDHPYITLVKVLYGWVYKMASFAYVQHCIYTDIVDGWVGQKMSKIMLT